MLTEDQIIEALTDEEIQAGVAAYRACDSRFHDDECVAMKIYAAMIAVDVPGNPKMLSVYRSIASRTWDVQAENDRLRALFSPELLNAAYHALSYISAFAAGEERKAIERMTAGYNILRSALAWFDSHSVEEKLGHLPQWVTMARELTGGR